MKLQKLSEKEVNNTFGGSLTSDITIVLPTDPDCILRVPNYPFEIDTITL